MSKVCEVCGKHPVAGRNVSHSHRVTNRVFRPNIQKITIKDKEGRVRKANVCTSCMKAGKVERAEPVRLPPCKRKPATAGFFALDAFSRLQPPPPGGRLKRGPSYGR